MNTVPKFYLFSERSFMLTLTLFDQALHYQLTTNNTSEKLVRLRLLNSFIFVKLGQSNEGHIIRKLM